MLFGGLSRARPAAAAAPGGGFVAGVIAPVFASPRELAKTGGLSLLYTVQKNLLRAVSNL